MAATLLLKMADFGNNNSKQQATATATSNSNKQQQQAGGLHSISRVRRSPEAPNLGQRVPYLRRSYPPSLGHQLPGGTGRRRHYSLKMPKNGPLETEMGPKGANSNKQHATSRWASFGILGTPIAPGPKLRPKGPLPKALLPNKFQVETH